MIKEMEELKEISEYYENQEALRLKLVDEEIQRELAEIMDRQ